MGKFLDQLTISPRNDGESWVLDTEFDYWTDVLTPRVTFHVPVGFVTDLASIPRIFWNILPPFGKYTGAAVIHDYLYQRQCYQSGEKQITALTRKQCDDVLMEAMGVLDVGWLTRWTIYLAVRSWGWIAWNGHKEDKHG